MNWYTVRIDTRTLGGGGGYTFQVEPFNGSDLVPELVAIDSVPGVIATVKAENPAAACLRAWQKALEDMRAVQSESAMIDQRNALAAILSVFSHHAKELPSSTATDVAPEPEGPSR